MRLQGCPCSKEGQEPPGLCQELYCQQAGGSDPSHLLSAAGTLLGLVWRSPVQEEVILVSTYSWF